MSNEELNITRRIHASSRFLDDKNYSDYLACYTEDGLYSISAKAPEVEKPMIWMKYSKSELADRLDSIDKHEWEIELLEQTRLVSVDTIDIDKNSATTSSSLAVYNTEGDGKSSCYVVGRYDDVWLQDDDNWYLQQREVVLKTRILSTMTPIPI